MIELTEERKKLREEILEIRREALSAQSLTESEKQTKINSLELETVSANVTIETKEMRTDKTKLDLVRQFFAAYSGSSRYHQR